MHEPTKEEDMVSRATAQKAITAGHKEAVRLAKILNEVIEQRDAAEARLERYREALRWIEIRAFQEDRYSRSPAWRDVEAKAREALAPDASKEEDR